MLKTQPDLVYHQMIEAIKFAYAPSTYLSDPNFDMNSKKVIL